MLAVLLVELVDVAVSVLVLVRLELEDVTEVLELLDVVFEVLPTCWMIWMVPIESGKYLRLFEIHMLYVGYLKQSCNSCKTWLHNVTQCYTAAKN